MKVALLGMFLLAFAASFISAVVVNADYVTIYPGDKATIRVNVENNENFDIEDISMALDLSKVPFSSVGSSEKSIDQIDQDDDDTVAFALRSTTDITPGDYDIPFIIKYASTDNSSEILEKEGSFGIRVSAKTDLDFSMEVRDNAIVGQEGRISLEVINKGLGEIKAVSVQLFPSGFELLSKDKVFIGSISPDDTDLASFDVVYKSKSPILSARVDYKDFDNNDQVKNINIPFKVYSQEEALSLGLIQKSNSTTYIIAVVVILVIWYFWRKARKKKKERERLKLGR